MRCGEDTLMSLGEGLKEVMADMQSVLNAKLDMRR